MKGVNFSKLLSPTRLTSSNRSNKESIDTFSKIDPLTIRINNRADTFFGVALQPINDKETKNITDAMGNIKQQAALALTKREIDELKCAQVIAVPWLYLRKAFLSKGRFIVEKQDQELDLLNRLTIPDRPIMTAECIISYLSVYPEIDNSQLEEILLTSVKNAFNNVLNIDDLGTTSFQGLVRNISILLTIPSLRLQPDTVSTLNLYVTGFEAVKEGTVTTENFRVSKRGPVTTQDIEAKEKFLQILQTVLTKNTRNISPKNLNRIQHLIFDTESSVGNAVLARFKYTEGSLRDHLFLYFEAPGGISTHPDIVERLKIFKRNGYYEGFFQERDRIDEYLLQSMWESFIKEIITPLKLNNATNRQIIEAITTYLDSHPRPNDQTADSLDVKHYDDIVNYKTGKIDAELATMMEEFMKPLSIDGTHPSDETVIETITTYLLQNPLSATMSELDKLHHNNLEKKKKELETIVLEKKRQAEEEQAQKERQAEKERIDEIKEKISKDLVRYGPNLFVKTKRVLSPEEINKNGKDLFDAADKNDVVSLFRICQNYAGIKDVLEWFPGDADDYSLFSPSGRRRDLVPIKETPLYNAVGVLNPMAVKILLYAGVEPTEPYRNTLFKELDRVRREKQMEVFYDTIRRGFQSDRSKINDIFIPGVSDVKNVLNAYPDQQAVINEGKKYQKLPVTPDAPVISLSPDAPIAPVAPVAIKGGKKRRKTKCKKTKRKYRRTYKR